LAVAIAVTRERREGETRCAVTPETVRKLIALGATVTVEAGTGAGSSIPDADYAEAGATVAPDTLATLRGADIVLKVRGPTAQETSALKPGAVVVALLDAWRDKETVTALAQANATAFAMEFVPRITRAQVMDALSSQANLAGYRAVIEAAYAYGKGFPMMMTAAGTVAAPRRGAWGRWSPPPTCGRRPRNRSSRWAPNSWRSRTRSSGTPRPPAATPSRCRPSIRPSRRR
jgi:NAD(P) transhydrogenase subunit alpha